VAYLVQDLVTWTFFKNIYNPLNINWIMQKQPLFQLNTDEFRDLIKEVIREILKEERLASENNTTLLNIQEAAALLNLAVTTIYEKTSERSIPYYKHGKKIMFKKSELLAWVESRRVKTIREIRQEASAYQLKTKSDKLWLEVICQASFFRYASTDENAVNVRLMSSSVWREVTTSLSNISFFGITG
jgi:excisionase family DNA binding protein